MNRDYFPLTRSSRIFHYIVTFDSDSLHLISRVHQMHCGNLPGRASQDFDCLEQTQTRAVHNLQRQFRAAGF